MSFTLANFKQQIDDTILQRGRQYYRSGRVVDLGEDEEGIWSAKVEGTETYDVDIQQEATGQLSATCTCPYDLGPVCKHVAAVLYAIEKTFPAYVEHKPRKTSKKRQTRQDKVLEILKSLAYEDLVDLLAALAEEDRQVANTILARYSDEGGGKKAYVWLVKDALNMGKGQYGFIDYWGSGRAARGVYAILQRAESDLKQGRAAQALPIFQAVVEAVVPAIAHADDSNGELGDCIRSALDGLEEAAKQLPERDRLALFDYCLAEAPSEPYQGWDWGWDLAQIAAEIVAGADQRKRLFDVLDQMSARRRNQDDERIQLSRYDVQRAEAIKLTVIERLDDDNALEAFLVDHIEGEPFRERLARFHIEHANFAEARRLCNEWLEQAKPQFPGYRAGFLAALLDIARLEKKPDEIVHLSQELFIDTGKFEHYDLLKQTIGLDAWPQFRDRLIETAGRGYRYDSLVPEIMVREEMWERLLEFVGKTHRQTVDYYRKYLESRFPTEVSAIYERIFRELLAEKANHKGYQMVCQYLRRMQKLGQGRRVDEIVAELRDSYKHRPALMEELAGL
jgi:hypothetical protein